MQEQKIGHLGAMFIGEAKIEPDLNQPHAPDARHDFHPASKYIIFPKLEHNSFNVRRTLSSRSRNFSFLADFIVR
jgi:hypothetical protein